LLASTIPDSGYASENGEDNDLGDIDLGEVQSVSSSRADELEEDIQLLRDCSFISVTSDPAVFEMHALVQLATQKWLGGDARYSKWRNKFIEVLDGEFPDFRSPNWPKAKALFPHPFAALQLNSEGTYAQPLLASLLFNAGHYADQTYAYANAERLWSTSLTISTQLFGHEHSHTRDTMYWLASVYHDQNRLDKAEYLFLQVLNVTRSLQEQDRKDIVLYMLRLSFIYRCQERLKEAEQLSLQIVELADDHGVTMFGLRDLADAYRLQGRLEEAEKLLLQAVEIGKGADGDNAEHTFHVMTSLGRLYCRQGRLHEAGQTLSRVQKGRQTVLGRDHVDTLEIEQDLADDYLKQGRLHEAELVLLRVHEVRCSVFGSDHNRTLSTETNLANVYKEQRRLNKAKELCTHVVESRKSILGTEHPNTLLYMSVL
jgi:tetratricopeptide (TPR) repeat protein